VSDCRSYVRSILATFEREVDELGFDIAIASSGTAETIARMIHASRDDTPLHTFNRFEFTVFELQSITETLAKKRSSDDRRSTPGLDPTRADIIVAGALLFEGVADIYGVKGFVFSEAALREGVLLDTIARLQGGALHHLRDVSRRSIRALAERCDDDLTHSAHVAALALQLFDATESLHGLHDDAREYLEAGALLANVGLVISHSKHHLHSYYVIRNSEVTGLTDTEIEIIAQIARYHRKSAPKASHAEFGRLSPDDQRLVRTLAGILRVAIGLDRSHDGRVRSVMAAVRRDRLVIEAESKRGKEISLELYTANERSDLLAEVLGQRVEIVAAPVPG
jgi:exopolyphosphatase/guanosine-5'-triphosphate,3'-diphosphate pyrophosphatase